MVPRPRNRAAARVRNRRRLPRHAHGPLRGLCAHRARGLREEAGGKNWRPARTDRL